MELRMRVKEVKRIHDKCAHVAFESLNEPHEGRDVVNLRPFAADVVPGTPAANRLIDALASGEVLVWRLVDPVQSSEER